jgi:hypothetical protein
VNFWHPDCSLVRETIFSAFYLASDIGSGRNEATRLLQAYPIHPLTRSKLFKPTTEHKEVHKHFHHTDSTTCFTLVNTAHHLRVYSESLMVTIGWKMPRDAH